MARRWKPRIFALEGEWSPRLYDRSSVEPLLETLGRVGQVTYIYRRVGTVEALRDYVRRWGQKQYSRYTLGYFAFHGSPGYIHLGRRSVALSELGEMLKGALRGRIIHFGTCETIDIAPEEIEEFRRLTGARAVSGYRESIDWLESAAFDLLLIDALTRYQRADAIGRYLEATAPDLKQRLGFRIHYGRRQMGG